MSYFKEFKGFDVEKLRDAAVIEIYDIAEDDMRVSMNDIYSGTYLPIWN